MNYRVTYQDSADYDATAIEDYLTERCVPSELVLTPISNRIDKDLAEFPYMYPVCPYDDRYRQMPVKSYLVLYHVDEERRRVEIHHIWHGMRNIAAEFKREEQ